VQTLAPEDALDGTDVSASIAVNEPDMLVVAATYNGQNYTGSIRLTSVLANRLALVVSGMGPDKSLREVGELEIESEVSR
jgi:hypothetical protein